MRQKYFGLSGLALCLVFVLFFGIDGLMSSEYLSSSFLIVFTGSVFLISTDNKNG